MSASRRQHHGLRREGRIDPPFARILDQRAERRDQAPVALGRPTGANRRDAAQKHARRQALQGLPAVEIVAVVAREDDEIIFGEVVFDTHGRGEPAQE